MIPAAARLAAAALLAAGAVARAEERDPVARAEQRAAALGARLDAAERAGQITQEPAGARAARAFAAGQRHLEAGDAEGAIALLLAALDAPEFRATTSWSEATWQLGEALRAGGMYGSALARYRELLSAPGAAHAGEAARRALECAVKLGKPEEAEELLAAARRLGGEPPAESFYLAAKAAWLRRDRPRAERGRAALALLEKVGPPWDLHADYFRGALRVAEGDLGPALAFFERCGAAPAADPRQAAVRELCGLGAARVRAAQGRHREAAAWYGVVPVASPRFGEAAYEAAYAWLRAGRPDLALRSAGILADLSPDSPQAPQALLLQGHLYQQGGRWGEAVETYNRVINQYAPVRDEVDAILSLQEDPVRDFDELVGRGEAGAVLPAVALRWAAGQGAVSRVLSLAGSLDGARRELAEARRAAAAAAALLDRNWGMGAFPELEEAYLRADAAHTAAVQLEAELGLETLRLLPISPARTEVEKARAARAALDGAVMKLPSEPEGLEARRRAAGARAAGLARAVHQLAVVVEGLDEQAAALRAWLDRHRSEIAGAEERPALVEELRRHREVLARDRAEAAALRAEVDQEIDVAGRGLTSEEDRQRVELRDRLAQEQEAMLPARRVLPPAARDRAARIDAVRARVGELVARADRVKRGLLARARAGGEPLKARVAAERRQLDEAGRELDRAQAQAKALVRAVARRAFAEVRRSFYELVLQADVGIIDVAWTRKRERVERIQALAARKALDLQAVEAAAASVPGEAD